MSIIYPGFVGYADIGGQKVRCNDFSVNIKQEALFYDHVLGLRDTTPTSIYTIKGDGGDKGPTEQYNAQKILWRPSVKLSQGGFTFPWTDINMGLLWEEARGGKTFDMDFKYACGIARRFNKCKVNSYALKVSNGDIVSSSLDIMAIHEEIIELPDGGLYTANEKIMTWDAVNITIDDDPAPNLVSFDFTINNACIPIYTAGSNASDTNPLEAKEIRVGMQQLTGTMSSYEENSLNYLDFVDTSKTIKLNFNNGEFIIKITAVFKPMEQSAAVGPVIRTLPFTGVDYNILVT